MVDDIKFKYNNKYYIIVEKFTKDDKKYLIYKEEDKEDIHGSLYEFNNDKLIIIPIEDDKDYDVIDEYLDGLK